EASAESAPKAGFSKLLDNLAGLTGFYGSGYKFETLPATPADESWVVEEPAAEQVEPTAGEPEAVEAIVEIPPATGEPAAEEPTVEEPAEEPAAEAALPPVEEPAAEAAPLPVEEPASEKINEPAEVMEGTLQSKLTEVRAKADEA